MARRIKAAGLKFLLDFHYSDFWADPGKQPTPQSWQGQDLSTLANTVYSYTREVIERLASQGTPVDMVQPGNEITNGMLWPQGEISVNGSERWVALSDLQANLNDLAPRYNKDIVIVETAYPWMLTNGERKTGGTHPMLLPGYPPTPEGQLAFLREMLSILSQVPDQRGRGLVYWESAWIPGGWDPGTGDTWGNMALFDHDGRALSSIKCYEDLAFLKH